MPGEQIPAFGDDEVDVLQDFELLVFIRIGDAHAGADHLEEIDDDERPVAFVGAKLAVIGVVDRDQRIDAGVAGRLAELQIALVVGQGPQRVAHQPDGGQAEVDHLDPGDGVEQAERRFHHSRDAGMAMESNPHLHGMTQQRLEVVDAAPEKPHERRHLERLAAGAALMGRQHHLGELHVAARTP